MKPTRIILLAGLTLLFAGCASAVPAETGQAPKLKKGMEQYQITRQKGTERAFTGKYYNCHKEGVYKCACCGAELFSSKEKYDSGSGWPSFWQPHTKENVAEHNDTSYGMQRTEVTCSQCGAHLGHVFEDGPQPTGQRYCITSASIELDEKK